LRKAQARRSPTKLMPTQSATSVCGIVDSIYAVNRRSGVPCEAYGNIRSYIASI